MALAAVSGCSPFGPDAFNQRQLAQRLLHGEPSINQWWIARRMQWKQGNGRRRSREKGRGNIAENLQLISGLSHEMVCVPIPGRLKSRDRPSKMAKSGCRLRMATGEVHLPAYIYRLRDVSSDSTAISLSLKFGVRH
jgi:hypothetical protein